MKMRKVLVTPAIARQWLDNARLNRSISWGHVNALKAEYLSGRFVPEQAPIRFDTHGRLWDGQHRLTALIEAGVSVYMYIEENCSEAVVNSHGLTRGRSVEDQFRIDGIDSKLSRAMATLGKMIHVRRTAGYLYLTHSGAPISCGQVMENLEWAGLDLDGVLAANREANNIYQMRRDLNIAPGEWTYLYAQRAPGFSEFIEQIKNSQPSEPSAVAFCRYCAGNFSNTVRKDRRRMVALVAAFANRDLKKVMFREGAQVEDLVGSKFPQS
jgi:hypothetical protein